jgi:predicted metal-dependent hydrolase
MSQQRHLAGMLEELWATICAMDRTDVEHNLLGKRITPKSATPATVPVNKTVRVTAPTKASINDARAIVARHLNTTDKKKATAKSLRELSMRYATGGVR